MRRRCCGDTWRRGASQRSISIIRSRFMILDSRIGGCSRLGSWPMCRGLWVRADCLWCRRITRITGGTWCGFYLSFFNFRNTMVLGLMRPRDGRGARSWLAAGDCGFIEDLGPNATIWMPLPWKRSCGNCRCRPFGAAALGSIWIGWKSRDRTDEARRAQGISV